MTKKYSVKVYWSNGDSVTLWNEKMAWVTENFGLPGKRWQTEVSNEYMILYFDNEKDCMFARLKLGI